MNVAIFILICTDTIVLEIITQFCEELEESESPLTLSIVLNCFDKFISTHILNLNHIQKKKFEMRQLLYLQIARGLVPERRFFWKFNLIFKKYHLSKDMC